MTDKRYLYRNPLAASWMQQSFGLKFQYRSMGGSYEELVFSELLSAAGGIKLGIIAVLECFVHPESLCLLDPQVGDLVLFTDEARASDYDGDMLWTGHGIYACTDIPMNVERIIHRDGKAFMWPESETA